MTNKTDHRVAAAQDIMSGLLAIAADTLRKMNKSDAVAAFAGVESGTHVLSFGVTITGLETSIKGTLMDMSTGASIDLPRLSVRPQADGLVVH